MTEIDTKYLREKNIAALLETIAAAIVIQKPNDPEAFIRDRFSEVREDLFRAEDVLSLYVVALCPLSVAAQIAAAFAKSVLPCAVAIVELCDAGISGAAAAGEVPLPAEFTQCSPFCRVPAMSHNGLGVAEAGCVLRYLCSSTGAASGANAVVGAAARQRVRIETALDTILNQLMPDCMTAVQERVFAPRRHQRPPDSIAIQAAATKFRAQLAHLQSLPASSSYYFAESSWLVGTGPTIADFALAAALFSMHHVAGYDCAAGLDKIQRWWSAVQAETWYMEGTRASFSAAAKVFAPR